LLDNLSRNIPGASYDDVVSVPELHCAMLSAAVTGDDDWPFERFMQHLYHLVLEIPCTLLLLIVEEIKIFD
jgi:hypothetical protein